MRLELFLDNRQQFVRQRRQELLKEVAALNDELTTFMRAFGVPKVPTLPTQLLEPKPLLSLPPAQSPPSPQTAVAASDEPAEPTPPPFHSTPSSSSILRHRMHHSSALEHN